jgi:cyclase
MIKKRLIAVVTVRAGWAVQSLGYRRYLPLGRPEVLVQNLDRWGADEIMLQCIDRSADALGPDFALLDRVAKLGIATPLVYSGGVRSAAEASMAVNVGADRIALDALLRDDPAEVARIGFQLGAQAVIAALPLAVRAGGGVQWYDYRRRTHSALSREVIELLDHGIVSEALLIDHAHEGQPGAFDPAILACGLSDKVPLIAFGGISEAAAMADLLRRPALAAVAVGNFLSYREHAVQGYKEALFDLPMRPAQYHRTVYP